LAGNTVSREGGIHGDGPPVCWISPPERCAPGSQRRGASRIRSGGLPVIGATP
jgi:hypothetical protein